MKLNFLIKALPFLSTIVLIIFLNISNQKENTKLRILIWNSPSYSLGTYIAGSTGIGFILSYILTTKLANINRMKINKSLRYKYENNNDEASQDKYSYLRVSDEKTLIERDINDPAPTVNAQFRVIGKTERYNEDAINDSINYEEENDYKQPYFDRDDKNESYNQESQPSSDWNDDSFSSW